MLTHWLHAALGRHHLAPPQDPIRENTMSNLLTEAHQALEDGIANVEGWLSDVKSKLPAAINLASRLETSPIYQALAAAVLPAHVEQEIAALITAAHNDFAAQQATPATPTADAPATSEQPTPAEPATPTATA